MSTDMIVGFDYGTLWMEDAREARAVADRVRGRMQAAIIETGRDLEAVKSRIRHGGFGAWLKAEF